MKKIKRQTKKLKIILGKGLATERDTEVLDKKPRKKPKSVNIFVH
jgi:hypothetical protein